MNVVFLVIFLVFLFTFGIFLNVYLKGEEEWVNQQQGWLEKHIQITQDYINNKNKK